MRVIAALLLPLVLAAADAPLPKGSVIESVITRADASQSYALYLPSGYTQERAWPILYCFDPGARGRLAVERFQAAAEKHGWIVAGSNNSRNGPFDVSGRAVEAVWIDTHDRFKLDPTRIYTAGFSGGARVATSVASAVKAAGTFVSGGGFPGSVVPAKIDFAVFGTAGSEDFNLPEVREIHRELSARGSPVRFAVFEGPHDWAPAALFAEGVEWMEFLAGHGIDSWRERRVAVVAQLESSGRAADACTETASLAADLKNEDWLRRARECAKSKPVREAAAREQRWTARENEYRTELESRDDIASRQALSALKKISDRADDSDERRMARRVLGGAFVFHRESARDANTRKDLGRAKQELEFCTRLRPDNPYVWYDYSGIAAQRGDRKQALDSLRRAIDSGFKDGARLQQDPAFENLRSLPEFQALLARLL